MATAIICILTFLIFLYDALRRVQTDQTLSVIMRLFPFVVLFLVLKDLGHSNAVIFGLMIGLSGVAYGGVALLDYIVKRNSRKNK